MLRKLLAGWAGPIALLIVIVAAMGLLRARFGGVAPSPGAFASHTAFDEAMARAEQTDRPVLALVTADWCGPCQVLKREGLADPRVQAWIDSNAVAAYVDATDAGDADSARVQRMLGIEGYPTLVLLRDGEEVSRQVGVIPADRLLAWLERAGG